MLRGGKACRQVHCGGCLTNSSLLICNSDDSRQRAPQIAEVNRIEPSMQLVSRGTLVDLWNLALTLRVEQIRVFHRSLAVFHVEHILFGGSSRVVPRGTNRQSITRDSIRSSYLPRVNGTNLADLYGKSRHFSDSLKRIVPRGTNAYVLRTGMRK